MNQNCATRFKLILIFFSVTSNFLIAQNISLPIEVLGEEGKVVTQQLELTQQIVNNTKHLWLQVNNLGYQNKASVRINTGEWYPLNHQTVDMQTQEKARGGMTNGGFNTIRFSIPTTDFMEGNNTLQFRFNTSDGISNGYRVIKLNLLGANKNKLLPATFFTEEDPMSWEAPYTDSGSIAEGKNLWYNANLKNNYLESGSKGFWYDYEIEASKPIQAKCASCHTQDGRDLEIFSYSNESIIERAKFHQLTEEEGKKLASYIRSLSASEDNVGRYGRPWNPPYQPGPEMANIPIEKWAAGAGLDAVLDDDKDMLPYMFPNGVNQEEVYKRFDSEKMVDRTTLPLAIQFPDWKHWLPIIHPMDAYTKNGYWNDPNKEYNPKKGYEEFRAYLEAMPPANRDKQEMMDKNSDFWLQYRRYLGEGGTYAHWRTTNGNATINLGDGVSREMAATSLARLMAVQYFEIMNEFNFQDKAHWFANAEDQPADRQWFGRNYQIFEVPPHFQACVDNNCQNFKGQAIEAGHYESTNWYNLQSVVNGGNGMVEAVAPVDYNYVPTFIMSASGSSGLYEPLRYYHNLNVMYQTRSWTGATTPNNGLGFKIRVQGPWHIIGRSDSHQLLGFPASTFPKLLDILEPGLSQWILNAQLRQFLVEVQKPENNIANWDRSPDGGSNTLDAIEKTEADLLDMAEFVGIGWWADKMYYLIPEFAKLGVDCQIIEEIIDWCAEAWPNINWDIFRSKGELQLQLVLENEENCPETFNRIKALTSNQGNDPTYDWWVNGNMISIDSDELSIDAVSPGDLVRCRITSNSNCITTNIVEALLRVPTKGFSIQASKNGEDWRELENTVACVGDEIQLKLAADIKPKLWLDAMDVNQGAEPANGALIDQWFDKSGNGYTVNATNDDLRPKYDATGMNGLPAIQFGASDNADGLELFDTTEDDFFEEDWTVILVGKGSLMGNWSDLIGSNTSASAADGWSFRFSAAGRTLTTFGDINMHGRTYKDSYTFIITISKEANRIKLQINNRLIEEFSIDPSTKLTLGEAIYLGQASGGNPATGRYHKGPIAELLTFDYKISDQEQNYLEGYLAQKWKITTELPESHPYKNSSPVVVTMESPDGSLLDLTNFQNSYVIPLDFDSDFGDYSFTKQDCTSPTVETSILNGAILDGQSNGIKYSIDNTAFEVANEVFVEDGKNIRLQPNYEIDTEYQWEMPDGTKLPFNTNPELTMNSEDHKGIWELRFTPKKCLTADHVFNFEIKDSPIVSISSKTIKPSSVFLYPNSASDKINIEGLLEGDYVITIYDLQGKKQLEKMITEKTTSNIGIQKLSEGLYFMIIKKKGFIKNLKFNKIN